MEQRRVFSNGEVVIKTDEGVFFHAHSESALPISIDKEDGEKLFKQADEEETTKQIDGVVKKLVQLRRAISRHATEIDEDDIGEFVDLREKVEDLDVEASMTISETLGLLNLLKSLVPEKESE